MHTGTLGLPAALALVLLAACTGSGGGLIALEGATLIDGSGGRPLQDAVVLIRDGRIEAVARVKEIEVPRSARVINLVGKTIMPGLIDAHGHLHRWAGSRWVAWGVTTVRDVHSPADSGPVVKGDFNLGADLGPRVFSSGPMIDGRPATYATATGVSDGDDARRAVDQRAVAGADLIKVYTGVTPAILRDVLDEARTLRLPVAAHLGKTDAVAAARAGVASIEHLSGIVQAAGRSGPAIMRAHDRFLAGWTAEERGWATLDSAGAARTAQALVRARVALVPTLALHEMLARLGEPALRRRAEMADAPAGTVVHEVESLLRRSGWRPADFAAFRRARVRQNHFVREFKRAGGMVLAGSDAPNQLLVPGAALHDELALLVEAGLSRLEAITAATRHAAQFLGTDSLGMVAPGKVADLVVLNANPAADIAATRDIAWVMTRGRIVRPDSLRATWKRG